MAGIIIDEKLSIGTVAIRIINRRDATELIKTLQTKNCGLTVVDVESSKGKVKIIFLVIKRKRIKEVIALLRKYNPNSFYSIEDIRFVSEGLPPMSHSIKDNVFYTGFLSRRKGK